MKREETLTLEEIDSLFTLVCSVGCEVRSVATELGLTTSTLYKWMVSQGYATWSHGDGYRLTEDYLKWGKSFHKLDNRGRRGHWASVIHLNLLGVDQVKKKYKAWKEAQMQ